MSTENDHDFLDSSHSGLVTQLMHAEHTLSAWTHIYHEAVAQALNINSTDHKCLDLLKSGPMTPGELAVATGLTTGAVTSVLDRLERRGFLKREHDSEDRRRIIVRVDIEKLKREVAPLFGCLEQGFTGLCADYSDEQMQFLLEYLNRCSTMLKDATETLREQGIVRPVETAVH